MKITVDFSELLRLATTFGPKGVDFQLDSEPQVFEPIDMALVGGQVVEVGDVDSKGGLLSYQGRQVLLYIKDHTISYDQARHDAKKGNRFHVAHCKTLESMRQKNRYQRYVATNNLSGDFPISAPDRPETTARLWVCQNCLRLLDYKQSKQDSRRRWHNAEHFNLSEFFATYSSCFNYMPQYRAQDKVLYTDDWPEISKRVRRSRGYVCEQCRVDTKAHRSLCHVHHKNGVKQDNSLVNLQVLCADCHRKEHLEHMCLSHEQMSQITQLRQEQGLLRIQRWDQVYPLVDPALHGDLRALQQQGYPLPQLGYAINTASKTKRLEVAWPEYQQALSVTPMQIAGWQVFVFGHFLAA